MLPDHVRSVLAAARALPGVLLDINAGTRRVVSDGVVVLHDPTGLLEVLVRAVRD